ncbi:hypothetical protein H9L39_03684 [Fusarium oxysporum f. sp. albedinis]|nr:hypothetical protein H9L39_03684 [Fusarium oxysporum f. sp. albedinis]
MVEIARLAGSFGWLQRMKVPAWWDEWTTVATPTPKTMHNCRQVKQRPLTLFGKSGAKYNHSPALTSGPRPRFGFS